MKKQITISIDEEKGYVDIESEDINLFYGNGMGGHGLQCGHIGGSKDYEKMEKLLSEIAARVRELVSIDNRAAQKRT